MDVLEYGILFYGGIVFGLDCIVMILVGWNNLCDIIVFFKIGSVVDLLINVLGEVSEV